MSLRRLETMDLVAPPKGSLTMAVARHLTPPWPHPDVVLLHKRRASLLHGFVDDLSLEVKDWGGTDAEHPSEIVELLLEIAPSALAAASTIIAAWITKPKPKASENEGLLGVKFKSPDGAELTISYRSGMRRREMAATIESFLGKGDKNRA